jgi:hypothetical protein
VLRIFAFLALLIIVPFAALGIANLTPLASFLESAASSVQPTPLPSDATAVSTSPPPVFSQTTITSTQDLTISTPAPVLGVLNLLNAERAERGLPTVLYSTQLGTASRLLAQARLGEPTLSDLDDSALIAMAGPLPTSVAIVEAPGSLSAWKTLETWQQNPKYELLLRSTEFSAIGITQWCTPTTTGGENCLTIAVLGT